MDAATDTKQRAGDALRASADIARDKVEEATYAAKEVASGAADQLQDQAREKQRSGADFIRRFSGNIREAARAFEDDVPFAARGINSAAEYVEDAAEKIRNAVIASVLVAIGITRLDARNLAPHETMRQLEKDKDTVKGIVR